MQHTIPFSCVVFALAVVTIPAHAQTKSSWTAVCTQATVVQTIPANQNAGSEFVVMIGLPGTCRYTGNIGGSAIKSGEYATYAVNAEGSITRGWGASVLTLATGDQIYITSQSVQGYTGPQTSTYQITGGTGKMQGIKGSGTCTTTYITTIGNKSCTVSYPLP
jgi:hypothetical protein